MLWIEVHLPRFEPVALHPGWILAELFKDNVRTRGSDVMRQGWGQIALLVKELHR